MQYHYYTCASAYARTFIRVVRLSEVEQQVLAAVTDGAPDKRQPWVTSDLCLSLIVETHLVYAANLNSWRTWRLGYVLCLVHCHFLCCLCVHR